MALTVLVFSDQDAAALRRVIAAIDETAGSEAAVAEGTQPDEHEQVPSGLALTEQEAALVQRALQDVVEQLGPDEVEAFVVALRKLERLGVRAGRARALAADRTPGM